jgi:hypothetical protein
MFKSLMHDVTLAIKARSGVSPAVLVWAAVIAGAALTAFAFLCVAAYAWLSVQFGGTFAGLIVAGVFVLIALIGAIALNVSRRRTRERAILERAARAHSPSWLLDPKILCVALQAGRTLGWQRIIPVALLGLLAAQWAREAKTQKSDDAV